MTGQPSVLAEHYYLVPLLVLLSNQQKADHVNLAGDLQRSSVVLAGSSIAYCYLFTSPYSTSNLDLEEVSPCFNIMGAKLGLYFRAVVQLCVITQNITESLYTAGARIRSLDKLHQDVVQLGQRLDD